MKRGLETFCLVLGSSAAAAGGAMAQTPDGAGPPTTAMIAVTLGALVAALVGAVVWDGRRRPSGVKLWAMIVAGAKFLPRHWRRAPGLLVVVVIAYALRFIFELSDPESASAIGLGLVAGGLLFLFEASGLRLAFLDRDRGFKLGWLGFSLGEAEALVYGTRLILLIAYVAAFAVGAGVVAGLYYLLRPLGQESQLMICGALAGALFGVLFAMTGRLLLFTPASVAGREVDPVGAWKASHGLAGYGLAAVLTAYILVFPPVFLGANAVLGPNAPVMPVLYGLLMAASTSFITGCSSYLVNTVMPAKPKSDLVFAP